MQASHAGEFRRAAFFGGIYSNYLALERAIALARARGAEALFALGDFGAFGPYPDRTVEILRAENVVCIQGNYEEALASGAEDCHCGYTDPRDNHFARISYDYTAAKTSPRHKRWMASLPGHLRVTVGGARLLLCHGSPRRINEFLWESTTSDAFIVKLLEDCDADIIVCTHTGLPWTRWLSGPRGLLNVGALGRPANDGRTEACFAMLEASGQRNTEVNSIGLKAEIVPVAYDHARLAREMESEGLPREFSETILTGWWTTCLEILPSKERARGRF